MFNCHFENNAVNFIKYKAVGLSKNYSSSFMKKFIIFIIILAAVAAAGWRWVDYMAFHSIGGVSNITKEIEINENIGTLAIGELLESEGIIKNKYYFYYYLWKSDQKGKIQAGKYELKPNMTVGEIVGKISSGEIVVSRVKLTVPEGFSNKKIIERIREEKPEIADEFERMASCVCLGEVGCNCDFFSDKYSFLKEVPKGYDMEGYLFPDTYFIEKDDTARTLMDKMLENYTAKVSGEMKNQIQAQGKTLYQIMTMASLIEKEVRSREDMERVSGIFWNRIESNHKLQSCATLAYILGENKPQYSIEDTEVESPYNTYKYEGLPPGPISNPGIDAISAAIYPEKTDYFYFLTDLNTGETIFSKTGEEHELNKQKHGL